MFITTITKWARGWKIDTAMMTCTVGKQIRKDLGSKDLAARPWQQERMAPESGRHRQRKRMEAEELPWQQERFEPVYRGPHQKRWMEAEELPWQNRWLEAEDLSWGQEALGAEDLAWEQNELGAQDLSWAQDRLGSREMPWQQERYGSSFPRHNTCEELCREICYGLKKRC